MLVCVRARDGVRLKGGKTACYFTNTQGDRHTVLLQTTYNRWQSRTIPKRKKKTNEQTDRKCECRYSRIHLGQPFHNPYDNCTTLKFIQLSCTFIDEVMALVRSPIMIKIIVGTFLMFSIATYFCK